jgi:DNA-binding XRE family transcriptional regulator
MLYKLEIMKPAILNVEPSNALQAAMMESIDSWYEMHNALTDFRSESGVTQAEVATDLEISQPAVSAFENENSLGVQLKTVISYAAALGLKINFSVEKVNWKETD